MRKAAIDEVRKSGKVLPNCKVILVRGPGETPDADETASVSVCVAKGM